MGANVPPSKYAQLAKGLGMSDARIAQTDNTPLTHEERRKVIEAPWPVVGIYMPKQWGGVTKRESLIPDGGQRSWCGHNREHEGDATDD